MVFYARDGSGPFYEAQETVIPDGEVRLAGEIVSGGTGTGFTGTRIVDVQFTNGRVVVGIGTFVSGMLTTEPLTQMILYTVADCERGIPGSGTASYFKEPTYTLGLLTRMRTYDTPAKGLLYFTIDYVYTDGLLTSKTITDHFNSLDFVVTLTYNAGVFAGKSFAVA